MNNFKQPPSEPTFAEYCRAAEQADDEASGVTVGVTVDDFIAYMPSHSYIYIPTREMWPVASVNARCTSPIPDLSAATWLDQNRPVEQMTWAPGEPMLIADRLVSNGGWIGRLGVRTFNLYRPPLPMTGDRSQAGKWIGHIDTLYGTEAAHHIIKYFAFKVQYPHLKINHALLLGGEQGIGKDTICEPLKYAVGPWNFEEISPKVICGRFNGYVKSVLLRVSEARDLGDINRFELYEHLKTLTASPPDVLRVDEKHLREYAVFNVCGVIITTNYKTNGIYLPAEDRRHYVAWSDYRKEDFTEEYWDDIWGWYDDGGIGHVVAYLQQLDIADFNPKAPPPKTEAFFAIVDANRSPDDAGLADALDLLGRPSVVTIDAIAMRAEADTAIWLRDRKNRRSIPYHLENCGYTPVRNDAAKSDGHWKINGKRQAVYGRNDLSLSGRIAAAKKLTEAP
jgi:hypothetical protein